MSFSAFHHEFIPNDASENVSEDTWLGLELIALISKHQLCVINSSLLPLVNWFGLRLDSFGFVFEVLHVNVFDLAMQNIEEVTEKFRAVLLALVWVENCQFFEENLFTFNSSGPVLLLALHHLYAWFEISTELDHLHQHLFALEHLMVSLQVFTDGGEHVEKCGAGHQRLHAHVHIAVDVGIG